MASAGSIFVDLLLRDANYKQGLNRARSQTQIFGRDVGSVFSGLTSSALKLAGAFGVGISVAGMVQAADKIALLSARIEQSTQGLAEFNQAFSELSRQSIDVGTDIANGVEIFQRISFSRKELKATNTEMLAFTETVQKLGAISGASGTALNAGLLQLGQGLSAGILRAEEFNSIMENIPAVGVAIADEFGISVGQLRQMVLAGEVFSRDVMDAILKKQDEVNSKFANLPVTLQRGLNSLSNGASLFISELNDGLGLTESIGEQLQLIGIQLNDNKDYARQWGASFKEYINIELKRTVDFLDDAGALLRDLVTIGDTFAGQDLFSNLNEANARQANRDAKEIADNMKKEYDKVTSQMDIALARQSIKGNNNSTSNNDKKEEDKRQKELSSIYERNRELITGLDSSVLKYQDTLRDLDALVRAGIISQDEYGQAVLRAKDQIKETTEATKVFGIDIESFSKRAAENIQDAFADFLFDPFQDGVKGMAKGFIDAVRRMIAEAQAAQLAQYLLGSAAGGKGSGLLGDVLGSISGAFSTPFNPATSAPPLKPFADGGYLGPGEFGIAGEAGAELLYGGKTGVSVFNQDQLGMNKGNNYNIDARGADQGAVNRLEQALLALAGPGVIERRVGMAQQRGSL